MRKSEPIAFAAAACLALGFAGSPSGATADGPTTMPAGPSTDELITLSFPDNVELKVLIEYVSDRLGLNVLYDEQVASQRVTLKTPTLVPRSSLQGILAAALRSKGLLLIAGDQPGWKRVVPAANLVNVSLPAAATRPAGAAGTDVVTEVFELAHGDPARADAAVRPFLTQPGGSCLPLPEQHLLVVTDYASTVDRVADLIRLMDRPSEALDVRFIDVRHTDAQQLAQQVTALLASASKGAAGSTVAQAVAEVVPDPRTNRLEIVGGPASLVAAERLAAQLDVPVDVTTRYYALKAASPERIDRLAKELVRGTDLAKTYQSVTDKDANLLIVTGTAAVQRQVADLVANLDVAVTAEQSPVRFYKLLNTEASDILATLQAIAGETPAAPAASRVPSGAATGLALSGTQTGQPGNGAGAGLGSIGTAGTVGANATGLGGSGTAGAFGATNATGGVGTGGFGTAGVGLSSQVPGGDQPAAQQRSTLKLKDATVTSDPNTNSLIVVAPPGQQAYYAQLIAQLDKRRPQVLMECTIVTLDTSNNATFGLEVGGGGGAGRTQFVSFGSFGLSTPSASTGQLTLLPGAGFNGAVLNPDVGSVIIQALATHSRARVMSAPKILVNDNATGTLSSVAEQPYTSVNASQTVSTTSFAGYASAGTTITLTPHISEADHLQLDYSVSLNSFTGQSSASGVPAPRQTDQVQSRVTIPDGSVVVVGGLNRRDDSRTYSGFPLIDQIPILRDVFSDHGRTDSQSTLFVFLRPVILRDDQFADLKYYSDRDVKVAGVPGDWPSSEPVLVR
jgi:general secretion pathway protein D